MCRHTYWNGFPFPPHTQKRRSGFLAPEKKGGCFPHCQSSSPSKLRSSFWLDLNQSKIHLRVGISISKTPCSYARMYTQLRIKNGHRNAFSVLLEPTIKTIAIDVRPIPQVYLPLLNKTSGGRGTGRSSPRLHFQDQYGLVRKRKFSDLNWHMEWQSTT